MGVRNFPSLSPSGGSPQRPVPAGGFRPGKPVTSSPAGGRAFIASPAESQNRIARVGQCIDRRARDLWKRAESRGWNTSYGSRMEALQSLKVKNPERIPDKALAAYYVRLFEALTRLDPLAPSEDSRGAPFLMPWEKLSLLRFPGGRIEAVLVILPEKANVPGFHHYNGDEGITDTGDVFHQQIYVLSTGEYFEQLPSGGVLIHNPPSFLDSEDGVALQAIDRLLTPSWKQKVFPYLLATATALGSCVGLETAVDHCNASSLGGGNQRLDQVANLYDTGKPEKDSSAKAVPPMSSYEIEKQRVAEGLAENLRKGTFPPALMLQATLLKNPHHRNDFAQKIGETASKWEGRKTPDPDISGKPIGNADRHMMALFGDQTYNVDSRTFESGFVQQLGYNCAALTETAILDLMSRAPASVFENYDLMFESYDWAHTLIPGSKERIGHVQPVLVSKKDPNRVWDLWGRKWKERNATLKNPMVLVLDALEALSPEMAKEFNRASYVYDLPEEEKGMFHAGHLEAKKPLMSPTAVIEEEKELDLEISTEGEGGGSRSERKIEACGGSSNQGSRWNVVLW